MRLQLASTILLLTTAAAAQGTTMSFSSFGTACGATLTGTVLRTTTAAVARLDVTNALAGAPAILVAGGPALAPSPLPNSTCTLLVNPRVTTFVVLDAVGSAAFRFQIPPIVPISVDFQALIYTPTRAGRMVESSNGTRFTAQ